MGDQVVPGKAASSSSPWSPTSHVLSKAGLSAAAQPGTASASGSLEVSSCPPAVMEIKFKKKNKTPHIFSNFRVSLPPEQQRDFLREEQPTLFIIFKAGF